MKIITYQKLKELLYYNRDTGVFTWKVKTRNTKIKQIAGTIHNKNGYRSIRILGKAYGAHRLAWLYLYGSFPKGEIDHINHIKDDNRVNNLREASPTENQQNRPMSKNNNSGHCGVHFDKARQKWIVHIGIGGKTKHLGRFTKKEDAIESRKKAEVLYGFHKNHGKTSESIINEENRVA